MKVFTFACACEPNTKVWMFSKVNSCYLLLKRMNNRRDLRVLRRGSEGLTERKGKEGKGRGLKGGKGSGGMGS